MCAWVGWLYMYVYTIGTREISVCACVRMCTHPCVHIHVCLVVGWCVCRGIDMESFVALRMCMMHAHADQSSAYQACLSRVSGLSESLECMASGLPFFDTCDQGARGLWYAAMHQAPGTSWECAVFYCSQAWRLFSAGVIMPVRFL